MTFWVHFFSIKALQRVFTGKFPIVFKLFRYCVNASSNFATVTFFTVFKMCWHRVKRQLGNLICCLPFCAVTPFWGGGGVNGRGMSKFNLKRYSLPFPIIIFKAAVKVSRICNLDPFSLQANQAYFHCSNTFKMVEIRSSKGQVENSHVSDISDFLDQIVRVFLLALCSNLKLGPLGRSCPTFSLSELSNFSYALEENSDMLEL